MVKEKALKHQIQLKMSADGTPELIRADERKLKQVLYNLLSNAVKFAADGGAVVLSARALSYCQNRWMAKEMEVTGVPFHPPPSDWVEISIQDTGIGIKQEDLERIFKPFEQGDISISRKYQGTGLGLSLSLQIVELHRGKIWAESEGPGKGSTFRFLIPNRKG